MRIVLASISLICCLTCNSQYYGQRLIDLPGIEVPIGTSLVELPNGKIIASCVGFNYDPYVGSAVFIRLDSAGNLLNFISISDTGGDYLELELQSNWTFSDSTLRAHASYSFCDVPACSDPMVFGMDTGLNNLWYRTYDVPGNNFARDGLMQDDGTLFMIGKTDEQGQGDAYFFAVDSAFNWISDTSYNLYTYERPGTVIEWDSGVYISSWADFYSSGSDPERDPFLMRHDIKARADWSYTYQRPNQESVQLITKTTYNLIAGIGWRDTTQYMGVGDLLPQLAIALWDSNGTELLHYVIVHEDEFDPWRITSTRDGGFAIAGIRNGNPGLTVFTGFAMKFDSAGNREWAHNYYLNEDPWASHRIFDIKEMANGDFAMVGSSSGVDSTADDVWFIRVDANGCFGPGNCPGLYVSQRDPIVLNNVRLFPNPVKDHLQLDLSNASFQGPFELLLTDMRGRVVLQQSLEAGLLNTTVELTQLASGPYNFSLFKDGEAVYRKRVVVE